MNNHRDLPMRMLFVVPLLGFMSFSIAAFVPQSVDTSRQGMLYGHLAHTDAIDEVELSPIGGMRRPSARVLPNGDFYFADLEPGTYVVSRYHSRGEWHELSSDRGVRELTVDVEAGAINFAGAWELRTSGMDVTAMHAEKPSPDVLLKRLRYSLRGTGWEKQIP